MQTSSQSPDTPVALVTGGCGYIGSQLIRDAATHPALEGHTIRILDNLHRENHHALLDLPDETTYEFVEGDILDPAAVRQALDGVDVVFHLAALVRTPFSYDHPEWTMHVNHWGTARILEDCARHDVSRFVLASSASVYGRGGPHGEDDPCQPVGPYSKSKREAERAAVAAAARGLDVTVLRLGTVYGGTSPGIRFDGLPNRFGFQAGTGQAIQPPGPEDQVWPFLHVEDASAALLKPVEWGEGEGSRILNAAEANFNVQEVARILQDHRPEVHVRTPDPDPHTYFSMQIDTTRFSKRGWSPKRSMEQALPELLESFGQFEPIGDMEFNDVI